MNAVATRQDVAECKHLRRVLSTPNGPTVEGKCKDCGHIRYFSSSLEGQYDERLIKTFESKAQSVRRGQRAQQEARKNRVNITLTPAQPQTHVLPVSAKPARTRKPTVAKPRKQPAIPAGQPYYQHPMTPLQHEVLAYVKAHGEVGTREVSDALGHDLNETGVRMRALVARGFLERDSIRRTAGAYKYRIRKDATPLCASGDGNAVLIPQGEGVMANG